MGISEDIILNKKILAEAVNEAAIYSDETINYMSPNEPSFSDWVKIRIRIGKDEADRVCFLSEGEEQTMIFEKSKGMYDYFVCTVEPESKNRSFLFKIICGDRILYYDKFGVSENFNERNSFTIDRNYKTPIWAKKAVGYQIFTDRFHNGDKTNDVVDGEYSYLDHEVSAVTDWGKNPESDDVFNFYGGDLQGVIDKLDYLKDLGINMIYFNPLFVSPSNHKYDIQDYDHIDPHIGKIVKDTNEDKYAVRTISEENLAASDELFAKLVEKAHEYGIRVIIDGVFNHCGSFNKWLDRERIYEKTNGVKGAFNHKDSPYRDYFSWKENGEYDSWWGHFNHPKLNYENSHKLFEYVMKISEKWLKPPFNADGWRIDVAADLGYSLEYNHRFWKEFRKHVKGVSSENIIIAEHYGDASDWLKGDEWDTVMNYDAFMEPVSWFFTGMEKHSDNYNSELISNGKAFKDAMVHNSIKMGSHAQTVSMNELSNHDHSRFLTRTNRRVGRLATVGTEAASENINFGIFKEAVIFQFIWSGIPTIYYGDEAGVVGWTDPDNRRTFPWGRENTELVSFHKEIIKIRKDNDVLTEGSCRFLHCEYGAVSIARFNDDDCIVAVFNNVSESREITVPVWLAYSETEGSLVSVMKSSEDGYDLLKDDYEIRNGFVKIKVSAFGAVVLKNK